jgi:CRP/FNR family transcriptional regulator, cyclic AMP receptor protein
MPEKKKSPNDYREFLRSGRWFQSLSDEEQAGLLGIAVILQIAGRGRLFARGDAPSGLYAMLSGSIRITASTDSGREALLTLAEPPGWFGEIGVFDDGPRTHDAIADEDSLVLHVPQVPLLELLGRLPSLWRALGLLMSTKLRLTFAAMEDLRETPINVRVARRLVLMAKGYGELAGHSLRVLDVRQEQLATMLGTSRQTVNHSLKELEGKGWIQVSYGQIQIHDFDALHGFAGIEQQT